MVIMIVLAVLVLAGLAAFVFSSSFRTFVTDELTGLRLLLQAYWPSFTTRLNNTWRTLSDLVGVYALILGAVALATLFLTILALLIGSPGFTGFAFTLSISLILLAWLPVGIITKFFGQGFVPKPLKAFVAWIAFVGFLGLVIPVELSFKVVIGAALVAFIMLGVTAKINILDKVIYPLVIVMVVVLAWQNFFPQSYRSSVRYASSWGKRIEAMKDRGSITNEAEAATTYAIVLKDVASLWELNPSLIKERAISLKAGDTVRLVDRRNEVTIYDGQGFVQIQLPRKNGSFFGGEKYWIEAEFVEAVSPREVIPERVVAKKQESPSTPVTNPAPNPRSKRVLGKGTHVIQLNRGEVSEEIRILSSSYCISSNQKRLAKLIYPNGSSKNLWEASSLPQNNVLFIESLVDDHTITINVL